jgi:hypothetical protein
MLDRLLGNMKRLMLAFNAAIAFFVKILPAVGIVGGGAN